MQIQVVGQHFAGNYNITNVNVVVHAACNAGIDDSVRCEIVDERLGADCCVDLCDAAADVDDTGVTHLVDIVVETSLFLDLRIGETQADVYEF